MLVEQFKTISRKAFQNLLFNQIKPVIPPLTKNPLHGRKYNIFQDACVRSLKGMGHDTPAAVEEFLCTVLSIPPPGRGSIRTAGLTGDFLNTTRRFFPPPPI